MRLVGGGAVVTTATVAGIGWLAYGYQPASATTASPWAVAEKAKTVDIPGYRINYIERGHGPVIVLLHGGGTWSYTWRNQIEPLARAGYRVLAPDMPGHGYTRVVPPYRPRFDLKETDRVIDEFLKATHTQRASLVGNSWGGGWALRYAQTHPDRVDKIVLIDAAGLPHKTLPIWEWMKVPVLGEIMVKLGRRSDVRQGLEEAVASPSFVTKQDVDEVQNALLQPGNSTAQVRFMRALDWSVTQADLPVTDLPALVIWGDKDRYIDVATGRKLAAALPNSRFVPMQNAGHVVHEERSKDVNQLIVGFLKSQ